MEYENALSKSPNNVPAEICLVGSFYKKPDLYVNYGEFIRSKYDFSDPAIRFFYDSFEIYYLTFSQTVDETKMNTFMAQTPERLGDYKKYKGWQTIQKYMRLADEDDCKNYYQTVKKHSLVREYGRNGFPVEKILNHKNFDKMTANDIYRIIRVKADQIHTVINAGEDAVDLTEKTQNLIDSYLKKPDFGLRFPWPMYNEYFLGMRLKKVMFEGFLSNEGKTRKLMLLAAFIALIEEEDFFFISNEMDEDSLKSCLITTVINNKAFQEKHGVILNKPEKEIVLGVYKDRDGNIIRRKIDDKGIYIESDDDFIERVKDTSDEYWQVNKVAQWIDDPKRKSRVWFKDVGDDYSMERIEFELRKAKMVKKVKYYGYDTLKGYNTDDWSWIKQFATRLKELTKEIEMSGFAVFQLSDDTVYTDLFSLSSNNIANAKQIKHVADILTLGKRLNKEEYGKYQMIASADTWGEPVAENLDPEKTYFGIKVDKNRAADKDKVMLFEINLNYNTWDNIGYLIKRPRAS